MQLTRICAVDVWLCVSQLLCVLLEVVLTAPLADNALVRDRTGSQFVDLVRRRREVGVDTDRHRIARDSVARNIIARDTVARDSVDREDTQAHSLELTAADKTHITVQLNQDVVNTDFLPSHQHSTSSTAHQHVADVPAIPRQRRSTSYTVLDDVTWHASRGERRRRSAAWMLSATIHLCNSHPYLCKRLELQEDEVKVKLNFQEA